YQLSSNVLAPGGNTPRIMETTGQVSHTGTSDYPHYRGYSQGNVALWAASVYPLENMPIVENNYHLQCEVYKKCYMVAGCGRKH
ncbi:hypothetical protein BUW94_11135, partial [Corynebacterium diphtheriae]